MAHEIGHLLLGTPEHSSRGIMRARWEREDLRDAARRCLVFNSEQAEKMRANVRSRMLPEPGTTRSVLAFQE